MDIRDLDRHALGSVFASSGLVILANLLRLAHVRTLATALVIAAPLALGWGIRCTWVIYARLRAWPGAQCLNCGYNLEGLPEAHRCPECGQEFERGEVLRVLKRLRDRYPRW